MMGEPETFGEVTTAEIDVLIEQSWHVRTGDSEAKLAIASEALAKSIAIGYHVGEAYARRNRGALLMLLGRSADALGDLRQAEQIFGELNERLGLASIHTELGIAYQNDGDLYHALEQLLRARALFQNLDDNAGLARTLTNIGNLYLRVDQCAEAIPLFEEAYRLQLTQRKEIGAARAQANLGLALSRLGRWEEAREFVERSRIIFAKEGLELDECSTLIMLIDIANALGNVEEANTFYTQAESIARQHSFQRGLCTLHNCGGEIALAEHEYARAGERFNLALDLSEKTGHADQGLRALRGLCVTCEAKGEFERGFALQKQVLIAQSEALMAQARNVFRIRDLIQEQRTAEHGRHWLEAKQMELENANMMLAAMNEHKDEILKIVSHDVRTPLGTIIGVGNLLRTEGVSNVEDAKELGSIVEDSGNRLLALTNSLLDLAKAQQPMLTAQFEGMDLGEAVRHIHAAFEPMAARKQIQFVIIPSIGIPQIEADRLKVEQILANLVSNALKFTQRYGEVQLSLSHKDQRFVRLAVQDTGIGIPPEALGSIFHNAGSHQRPGTDGEIGTGLGMPIVKRFMELHHGSVAVESRVGVGTKITLDFPVNHADE